MFTTILFSRLHIRRYIAPLLALIILALAGILLSLGYSHPKILDQIDQAGVLRVGVLNHRPYYDPEQQTLEQELLHDFARTRHLTVETLSISSVKELNTALKYGLIDIALGGLSKHQSSMSRHLASDSIQDLGIQVVSIDTRFEDAEKMTGRRLAYVRDSHSQDAWLRWSDAPQTLELVATENSDQVLRLMEDGLAEYGLMNSLEFTYWRQVNPDLKVVADLNEVQQMVWYLRQIDDSSLSLAVNDFLNHIPDTQMTNLLERYYGHLDTFDYVGNVRFERHIDERLVLYIEFFKEAAQQNDLDWRVLAAISYQESHWRPRAVSPTGVKGLMMITLTTAAEVGVTNRLDPEQSITGGARYFASLLRRIPERVLEPDRSWLAMAAYNVGMGHLEDARKITQFLGNNPDIWSDVREALPLLADKDWYPFTTYGYARGHEPVVYVENIRQYVELLMQRYPMAGEQEIKVDEIPLELPNIVLPPTL